MSIEKSGPVSIEKSRFGGYMEEGKKISPIGYIRTDMPEKFGIPRQSGLVPELYGELHFVKEFNTPDCVKGIEQFSHLWIIWDFSANVWDGNMTVTPPRLGGKERVGVFACRAPYRPNGLALSLLKLHKVRYEEMPNGEHQLSLLLSGVDMLDGSPVYDIKPYIPYAEAIADARGGFADEHAADTIEVDFPKDLLEKISEDKRNALLGILKNDPRAAYNKKEDYVYGLAYADKDVRFVVSDGVLKVLDVVDRDLSDKIK